MQAMSFILLSTGEVAGFVLRSGKIYLIIPHGFKENDSVLEQIIETVYAETGKMVEEVEILRNEDFNRALLVSKEVPWGPNDVRYKQFEDARQAFSIMRSYLNQTVSSTPNPPRLSFINAMSEWGNIIRQYGGGRQAAKAAETEGISVRSKGGRGLDTVYVNGEFYTVGAIVHEMFHCVSSTAICGNTDSLIDSARDLCSADLEEGLTEYLTCEALGIQSRNTKSGGSIYSYQLKVVKDGIVKMQYTPRDILNAYFHGDRLALKKIADWFNPQYEKATSFLYQAKSSTS